MRSSLLKGPFSDMIPYTHKRIWNTWYSKWSDRNNLVTAWLGIICPSVPKRPWFYNLGISRRSIQSFCRLTTGHNLLPLHTFRPSLNSVSPDTLRMLNRVMLDTYYLNVQPWRSRCLFLALRGMGVPWNTEKILRSSLFWKNVIFVVLQYFSKIGFPL